MMLRAQGRELVPVSTIGVEAGLLRAEAERRYLELQLLTVALQEHIDDLRIERDRLLSQVARMRDDARRNEASWLDRGMKGNRP